LLPRPSAARPRYGIVPAGRGPRPIAAVLAGLVPGGALALVLALVPAGPANAASGDCTTSGNTVTCTFTFTGGPQTWTVPANISQATFAVWGAEGGVSGGAGGLGAKVDGTLPVTAGTALQINVGQAGMHQGRTGFGGGGSAGTNAASGGGASDVRSPAADGSYPLANRLLVAGGGGGGAQPSSAPAGQGGNAGQAGTNGGSSSDFGATLGGGGGGGAGTTTGPGAGGAGGTVTGTASCPPATSTANFGLGGTSGGTGASQGTGGHGGDEAGGGASGGGGGGGYFGGGGGGSSAADGGCGVSGGGGGGGGGASFTGNTGAGVSVSAAPDAPNGEVIISYQLPAAATTTTVSAPATGTAGTAIPASSISAALSGATSDASGTITFTVFGPQSSPPADCTSGGTTVGTAAVSGNGTYNPSAGFTPGSAGTYWWYASYGGDASNLASTSGCGAGMTSTVVSPPPADLSLTNTGSPNPVISGQQLTYTITATNTGGQTATSVSVKDTLPASAHYNSASATQGTCTRPATSKGGTVTCTIGNLTSGAKATVTIVVTTTTPGTLTDTATTTAANVTTDSDDSATAATTVRGT
jgi:uncharacterized repeat protein (TIGR01451 family)